MASQKNSTSLRSCSATESATPSSVEGSQDTQLHQRKMKDLMESELTGATYFVDQTTEGGFLHVDPNTLQLVINDQDLVATQQALQSGGNNSPFPDAASGFSTESSSYEPVVNLLNKIIDTAKRHIPPSQNGPLSGLRFHHFKGTVSDRYDSIKGLKPDGVGVVGDLPNDDKLPPKRIKSTDDKRLALSWDGIEIFVESKASVKDMVRQSATYARCSFLSNQRRSLSLGIGFQYKKLEAYVLAFHRAGLSSSRPLLITAPEGFKDLVAHIVGIISFKNDSAYGLDTTRSDSDDLFCISNRYFKSVRLLHQRKTVRGRATLVHSLQGMYTRRF